MAFQMICVQLHEAGQQVITIKVLADPSIAFVDSGNFAITQQDRAMHDPILCNNAGV